ncbi:hypothetical protein [Parasphingopyxis sp. CP4]|uniref:hypothetical protein n=1 Tax=Parasphingopyxis sp. CP4 TaxID=2724527 RepID=UPI002102693A|nr:hypothetical protein [Parasphingopyxis sp. CP4]
MTTIVGPVDTRTLDAGATGTPWAMAALLAKAIDEMPARSERPERDTRENMYNPICTRGIRLLIVFDNDNDYQKQSKKLQM